MVIKKKICVEIIYLKKFLIGYLGKKINVIIKINLIFNWFLFIIYIYLIIKFF